VSDRLRISSFVLLGLLGLRLTALAATPSAPPLFTDDFAHGLDQWSVEQLPGGSVTAQNGILSIVDAGGTTVWFRSRLTAPVEISYEATVVLQGGPHDRLSDLNCFWLAQDPTQPAGALPAGRSGKFSDYDNLLTYYVGYGGNNNTTTRFRRYDGTGDRPLLPEHDRRDPALLLTANHAYRIKIVVQDGTSEYWRDGEKVFSLNDASPLTTGYFAFRTVRSHLLIRNFKITTPAPAP
jgi:hypothetical protein